MGARDEVAAVPEGAKRLVEAGISVSGCRVLVELGADSDEVRVPRFVRLAVGRLDREVGALSELLQAHQDSRTLKAAEVALTQAAAPAEEPKVNKMALRRRKKRGRR